MARFAINWPRKALNKWTFEKVRSSFIQSHYFFWENFLSMQKKSTPMLSAASPDRPAIPTTRASVRCSTVAFLRQFARAYNFVPLKDAALGSVIAN